MRIIAGAWRGRRLAALGKGDAGAHLRPTPDRIRESLFSMLEARQLIGNARVLDMFAGTGALGLEALSRGAAEATFVENGRTGQALIGRNIAALDAPAKLIKANATRLPPCRSAPFDLVFLDPPYGKDLGARALSSAAAGGWLATGCSVIWEEASTQPAPEGFQQEETRNFGNTFITLLRFN